MKNKNKEDKSVIIPQRTKINFDLDIYQRSDLTPKQKEFLNIALDKNTKMMFIDGPAGTSKTYLSILAGLQLINTRRISDIIYVRSAVESSDSKLGFLPGSSSEKMAPYIQPLLDKLEELLPKRDIDALLKEQRVSGMPVGFLRGLSWNAKVIVCDEAQNMGKKELITLITRLGEFSKIFVSGDILQSDINGKSGFKPIFDLFNDEISRTNGIYCFQFTKDDVVRSGILKFILEKVEQLPK